MYSVVFRSKKGDAGLQTPLWTTTNSDPKSGRPDPPLVPRSRPPSYFTQKSQRLPGRAVLHDAGTQNLCPRPEAVCGPEGPIYKNDAEAPQAPRKKNIFFFDFTFLLIFFF